MRREERKLKLFLVIGTVLSQNSEGYFYYERDNLGDELKELFKEDSRRSVDARRRLAEHRALGPRMNDLFCPKPSFFAKCTAAEDEKEAIENVFNNYFQKYLDDSSMFEMVKRNSKGNLQQMVEILQAIFSLEDPYIKQPINKQDWVAEEVILQGYNIVIARKKKKKSGL